MPKPESRAKGKPKKKQELKFLSQTTATPDLSRGGSSKKWIPYLVAAVFFLILLVSIWTRDKVEAPAPTPPLTSIPASEKPPVVETVSRQPDVTAEPPLPAINILPEIVSIKLNPKLVYPGTKIKAEVEGNDKDGDAVSFYYEWKKNGRILSGMTSNELDTTGLKKGELITLYVTPFDGKEKGKTAWSTTIMIANRAPEITSVPPAAISNGKYIYEVKAVDPDGDTLTFTLEDAPQDMTIDPSTGVIHWDIPSKAENSYNVRVAASDGDAKAFQGFTLSPKIEIK